MPNIPIREHTRPPQNSQPRQAQYNTSQYNTSQMRSTNARQPQTQGRTQGQPVRYTQPQGVRSPIGRPSAEQLRPMKTGTKKPNTSAHNTQSIKKKPSRKPRRKRERTTLGDFFLSFFVALFVFGVAAIFVCNALISLFAS